MSDEVKPWRGQWRVKAAVINGEPWPPPSPCSTCGGPTDFIGKGLYACKAKSCVEPLPVSRAKPAKALTVVIRGADGGEQELRGEDKAVGR